MLFLNKRKQMVLDKSSNAILKKKKKSHEAPSKLADYLKNSSDAFDLHLYKLIDARTSIKNDTENKELFFKNQLNKEVLLLEQKFLEDYLQKEEN